MDRQAIEILFRVRQRRARQIMAGLPGLQVGNAYAVERTALIHRLEGTGKGALFQWEISRRGRLREELDRSQQQVAARQIRIPTTPDVRERSIEELGPGIQLRPGELLVTFSGAADLAAKLFELSQAMANDWTAFSAKVERKED